MSKHLFRKTRGDGDSTYVIYSVKHCGILTFWRSANRSRAPPEQTDGRTDRDESAAGRARCGRGGGRLDCHPALPSCAGSKRARFKKYPVHGREPPLHSNSNMIPNRKSWHRNRDQGKILLSGDVLVGGVRRSGRRPTPSYVSPKPYVLPYVMQTLRQR